MQGEQNMGSSKVRILQTWVVLFSLLGVFFAAQLLVTHGPHASAANAVHLQVSGMNAVMSNGIYTIEFNGSGDAYSLVWKGKELIGSAKGFYNLFETGGGLIPTQLKVVTNTSSLADIAYISNQGELHYVIQNNVSGLYSYFVASNIGSVAEFRTVYQVDGTIFRNGSNAERSGPFPTLSEIQHSTVLQNETFQLPDGTVYSKYDGATYVAEDHVHGVYGGGYGVWLISASHEYNNGGPMKQELTVHVDSSSGDGTVLNVVIGSHFGSPAVQVPHGKIFGPWLIYFNNGSSANAQAQATTEEAVWPYTWLSNPNYPLARTTVTGTLRLADGRAAAGAMVTLAQPGGDLYAQGSNYIFYAQANAQGQFTIPHVRQYAL
jgi:rhamnogalacturonan endolyase